MSEGKFPYPAPTKRLHQKQKGLAKANLFICLETGGGEEEDRTPDLRIANATLSQLSYPPDSLEFSKLRGRFRLRTQPRLG